MKILSKIKNFIKEVWSDAFEEKKPVPIIKKKSKKTKKYVKI